MTTSTAERAEDLYQDLMRAWRNYDIWWVYKSAGTRPLYEEVINRFGWFFEASIHAHFVAMVMALSRLFDRDPKSVSLPTMASARVTEGHAFKRVSQLWGKLKIVRDKAIAHRDARLNWEQAFKSADMKYDDVYKLLEGTTQLVNDVLRTKGKRELKIPTEMCDDLIRMLETLKRAANAGAP